MPVKIIKDNANFQSELANVDGTKLLIIYFSASWCGPCRTISPIYEELSNKHSAAVFMKVDVDECVDVAEIYSITAMPTFIFLKNKVKVGRLTGGDPRALENKIVELLSDSGPSVESSGVPGHVDLSSFLNKPFCECLNESDDHPYTHCLTNAGGYLESDCDEQLIMSLTYNQSVKLHSLKIKAPEDKGPKSLRLFINQPRTLDFDQACSMESIQDIQLETKDMIGDGGLIPLRYVKFQNVQNLQIFVKDNQDGGEVTQIDHLAVIGSPINTTKMGDFKRVAGKKGESH